MLEWKTRLVVLAFVAAAFAETFGNYGWIKFLP